MSNGGINLIGHFTGGFGNARTAQYFVDAVMKSGARYCLKDIAADTQTRERRRYAFTHALRYPVSLYFCNADAVKGVHAKADTDGRPRYDIGAWWWETEDFPAYFQSSFRAVDEVWVTSDFVYRAIKRVSPVPVVRLPFPYVPPAIRPKRTRKRSPFTFLFIFDYSSDFERKNPCAVVAAFKKAFPKEHDVRLIVKSIDGRKFPAQQQRLAAAAGRDRRVSVFDESWTRERLYRVLCDADVFVSLHRSEGMGQNLLDAIYFEKPVIATAYGGNCEFMPADYPFLVKYRMKTCATSVLSYPPLCRWADPDIAQAAQHMRAVYERYPAAQKCVQKIKTAMLRRFDPSRTAAAIAKRLSAINARVRQGRYTLRSKDADLGLMPLRRFLAAERPQTVLFFATVRQTRAGEIIDCIKDVLPGSTLAIMGRKDAVPASCADRYFMYPADGDLARVKIPRAVWRRMQAFKPDLIIVPFFSYYGKSYGNVFGIVRALGARQAIGIGCEGDIFDLNGRQTAKLFSL